MSSVSVNFCYIFSPEGIIFWKENDFALFNKSRHTPSISPSITLIFLEEEQSLLSSQALEEIHLPRFKIVRFCYFRFIRPSDNRLVWLFSIGDEGWHNYHHAFPWDYRSSDLWGYRCGITAVFIEFCAKLGWIYDLKTTSLEVTLKRRQRTGDLTCNVWGWNDTSIDPTDRKLMRISEKYKMKKI